MGAGAVGCYYGFKLARAGHDVMLIGRPQLAEAIERHGLRLETQTFDEHIRVSASTEGSAVQGAQLPGGHFDPYRDQFPVAEAAATQWFCEHLVGSDALHARLACLPHSSRRRLKLASGILRK